MPSALCALRGSVYGHESRVTLLMKHAPEQLKGEGD